MTERNTITHQIFSNLDPPRNMKATIHNNNHTIIIMSYSNMLHNDIKKTSHIFTQSSSRNTSVSKTNKKLPNTILDTYICHSKHFLFKCIQYCSCSKQHFCTVTYVQYCLTHMHTHTHTHTHTHCSSPLSFFWWAVPILLCHFNLLGASSSCFI